MTQIYSVPVSVFRFLETEAATNGGVCGSSIAVYNRVSSDLDTSLSSSLMCCTYHHDFDI